MEELDNTVSLLTSKMKLLENFVSLFLNKSKISKELQIMSNKTRMLTNKVEHCESLLNNDLKQMVEEHKETMSKMRKLQLIMLNVMEEVNKKKKASFSMGFLTPQIKAVTPRMYLHDYEQSPLVLQKKPIAIQFLDFEVEITDKMFNSIPKYLRGRETVSELRSFFNDVIVCCFSEKYQLLGRQRSTIRNPQDLEAWKLYRDQSYYFPGKKFITQGDVSKKMNRTIDKKTSNRIAMLRHLNIMQEQRKNQVVCYIWIAS